MTDIVFVLLTIGFFALAVGLVKVCDGFIDTEPVPEEDAAEAPADEAEAVGA
jgi:hypothetical protein